MKITITGPAGCGKTRLARLLKELLEYKYDETNVKIDPPLSHYKYFRYNKNVIIIETKLPKK